MRVFFTSCSHKNEEVRELEENKPVVFGRVMWPVKLDPSAMPKLSRQHIEVTLRDGKLQIKTLGRNACTLFKGGDSDSPEQYPKDTSFVMEEGDTLSPFPTGLHAFSFRNGESHAAPRTKSSTRNENAIADAKNGDDIARDKKMDDGDADTGAEKDESRKGAKSGDADDSQVSSGKRKLPPSITGEKETKKQKAAPKAKAKPKAKPKAAAAKGKRTAEATSDEESDEPMEDAAHETKVSQSTSRPRRTAGKKTKYTEPGSDDEAEPTSEEAAMSSEEEEAVVPKRTVAKAKPKLSAKKKGKLPAKEDLDSSEEGEEGDENGPMEDPLRNVKFPDPPADNWNLVSKSEAIWMWNVDKTEAVGALKVKKGGRHFIDEEGRKFAMLPHAFPEVDENDEMWKVEIEHENEGEREWTIKCELYFNIARFEYAVRTGQPIAHRHRIFMDVEKSFQFDWENFNDPHQPLLASSVPQKQPNRLQVRLYKYQLRSLAWMKSLEERTSKNNGWQFSTLATWEHGGDVMFDMDRDHQRFYLRTSKFGTMKTRGGILGDEMGLGKTLTMVALILANPCPLPLPNYVDLDEDNAFFRSKATFVACPSHLCAQWADEMTKHVKPKLKVIIVTTKPQHQKVTYADIIAADVVIVSFQFLKNKNHYGRLGVTDRYGNHLAINRAEATKTSAMELMRRPDPLSVRCPSFEHFHYHRVVADEAHEIMRPSDMDMSRNNRAGSLFNMFQILCSLRGTYRWYVSGTPFPSHRTSLEGALKFLQWDVVHPDGSHRASLSGSTHWTWIMHDLVMNNMYTRNTKASIGDEHSVPEFVEDVQFVELTDVERGMYNAARGNQERERQICCHPQITDEGRNVFGVERMPLDQIRAMMTDHTTRQCASEKKKHERLLLREKQARQDLSKATSPERVAMFQREIRTITDDIHKSKQAIAQLQATLGYFQSLVPSVLHSAEGACVVCLDELDVPTITPCGHIYCRECIQQCVGHNRSCPTCRKDVNPGDLTEIVTDQQKKIIEKNNVDKELAEKYGSKLASLIRYIRDPENKDARFIIFAQWDNLLKMIGDDLSVNNISNVYCHGNVHQRNAAIGSFKQNKVQAIMLSLDHAASGTNLTEATHIIMMHPMSGTGAEARAAERQAIGRAHRIGQDKQLTVVRFLCRGTVEETLYNRNNADQLAENGTNEALASSVAFGGPMTSNAATLLKTASRDKLKPQKSVAQIVRSLSQSDVKGKGKGKCY